MPGLSNQTPHKNYRLSALKTPTVRLLNLARAKMLKNNPKRSYTDDAVIHTALKNYLGDRG